MSDHDLLSLDNSGSGWNNVLLAQKINKGGLQLYCPVMHLLKKYIIGGMIILDWRVGSSGIMEILGALKN